MIQIWVNQHHQKIFPVKGPWSEAKDQLPVNDGNQRDLGDEDQKAARSDQLWQGRRKLKPRVFPENIGFSLEPLILKVLDSQGIYIYRYINVYMYYDIYIYIYIL